MSAWEETPGLSRLVMQAQRAIEAAWATGPAQHLATQAAEALDDRRMLIDPEVAEEHERTRAERDALRQVVALVLLHDAAGEAIDCDRLRGALEDFQIDLTPEIEQHESEWAAARLAGDGGGSR